MKMPTAERTIEVSYHIYRAWASITGYVWNHYLRLTNLNLLQCAGSIQYLTVASNGHGAFRSEN